MKKVPWRVANTAWVSMLMCILVVALVWSNWEWSIALTLECTVLYNTLSFLEAGAWIAPVQALLFLDDVLMGSTISVRKVPISLATALDAAIKNCWTTLMLTAR